MLTEIYPNQRSWILCGGWASVYGPLWLWGGFLSLMDWTQWLSKYKVQPGKNEPPNMAKFKQVIFLDLEYMMILMIIS
jgi:hypothetical protein